MKSEDLKLAGKAVFPVFLTADRSSSQEILLEKQYLPHLSSRGETITAVREK